MGVGHASHIARSARPLRHICPPHNAKGGHRQLAEILAAVSSPTLDVDALLHSITTFRGGGHNPADVFTSAGANEVSDEELVAAVRPRLEQRPDLVELWQSWSYEKRWSPSPYLDGVEVGHYDAGSHHVRRHTNAVDACADFVLAEVRWVVDGRVIGS